MQVQYEKARAEDYDDVIDFGNLVFSHAHVPHDFPSLLPKLYKRAYFMDGIHYTAREGGRIKAVVGAYPLEMNVCGSVLSGRGIGMVSVHPYCRSRGFMKILMEAALEDMIRDGAAFGCLGGQRQRYEYFGFTPLGLSWNFECTAANTRHVLGRDFTSGLSLKRVQAEDTEALDYMRRAHEAKTVRVLRREDRFFDIITSWKSRAFAVMEGPRPAGYILYKPDERLIHEIHLEDVSRMAEVIALFLRAESSDAVTVKSRPHEAGKLAALAAFAERYTQGSAYHFAVFDYRRFVPPFLRLKCSCRTVPDGSFTLPVEGGLRLRLSVSGGKADLRETHEKAAELPAKLPSAARFLFSADYAAGSPLIAANPFLQSLLPLPLSFETADEV